MRLPVSTGNCDCTYFEYQSHETIWMEREPEQLSRMNSFTRETNVQHVSEGKSRIDRVDLAVETCDCILASSSALLPTMRVIILVPQRYLRAISQCFFFLLVSFVIPIIWVRSSHVPGSLLTT